MIASEIVKLLEKKYDPASYAFFTEFPDGTGGAASRRADAIAFSLWPSRGLYLTGLEIKVSRSDWLNELKKPAKCETFAQYCAYWYVVAPKKIILEGECPDNWGVIEATSSRLKVVKPAPRLESKPFDKFFIASVCRQARYLIDNSSTHKTIRDEAYQRGKTAGAESVKYELERLRKSVEESENYFRRFKEITGVYLNGWDFEKISERAKFILQGGEAELEDRMKNIRSAAKQIIEKTAHLEKQ